MGLCQRTDKTSAPSQVTRTTHVAIGSDGSAQIDNLPPSWVKLFREAGATEKELSDPNTVFLLMETVASQLSKKTKPTSAQPPAATQPPPAIATQSAPPSGVYSVDSVPKASGSGSSLYSFQTASEPTQSPPAPIAPPPESAPPIPNRPHAQAPVAPVAPPPPAVSVAPSSPAMGDLQDQLANTKLHHAEVQKPSTSSSSSLLSEIRQGHSLRHVDPNDLEKLSTEDKHDLTSVLARALDQVRGNLRADVDDDAEADAGYWSD